MLDEMYEMETKPNRPEMSLYIQEDVAVIDVDGEQVGMVKHFQTPSASANPDINDFPPSLRSTSLPDELILRLLNSGFICVNTGFLTKDRFVFLNQVDHITEDEVHLHVAADELLKA